MRRYGPVGTWSIRRVAAACSLTRRLGLMIDGEATERELVLRLKFASLRQAAIAPGRNRRRCLICALPAARL